MSRLNIKTATISDIVRDDLDPKDFYTINRKGE